MVAYAHDCSSIAYWYINCHWWRLCHCSIYLHAILMKKQNNKEIILTIVVGLMVFFYFFKSQWLFNTAIVIGILGVFSDFVAEKIAWVWLKFAEVLGRINSTILLSLIFFIFLTPIALLMRVFKKTDALKLKKITGSVYDERNHTYTAKDLENTW